MGSVTKLRIASNSDEKEDHDTPLGVGDAPFRCLGYDEGTYFYLPKGMQQVRALTASAHTRQNLMSLAPLEWWECEFPARTGGVGDGKVLWDKATNALMRRCEGAGVFSMNDLRGRGAWIDAGRVVVHCGDAIYDGSHAADPSHFRSAFIYPRAKPVAVNIKEPLSVEDTAKYLNVLRMFSFGREIDALYVAGWAAVAPICGALDWRPHIWIIGGRGTGKSTLMKKMLERAMGPLAVTVAANTTEAGIRQRLKSDALAVLFEEAEGEATRDVDRLQGILQLARQSSTETGAEIVKGSSGGTALSFSIRSCFAFNSINASLVQQSDKSRVTVVELREDCRKFDTFNPIAEAVASLMDDEYAARFLARSIAMAPIIRDNVKVFSSVVAVVMGEQRAGDQIGTLLAGAWSLRSDERVTYEEAREWVETQDWREQRDEVAGMKDEVALRNLILGMSVRVSGRDGSKDITVSEAALIARGFENGPKEDAIRALGLAGLKVSGDMMAVADTSAELKRWLRDTPWSVNWGKVLKRLPGAKECRPRFAPGAPSVRAVSFPLTGTDFMEQMEQDGSAK